MTRVCLVRPLGMTRIVTLGAAGLTPEAVAVPAPEGVVVPAPKGVTRLAQEGVAWLTSAETVDAADNFGTFVCECWSVPVLERLGVRGPLNPLGIASKPRRRADSSSGDKQAG